jgi:hypothetical protein
MMIAMNTKTQADADTGTMGWLAGTIGGLLLIGPTSARNKRPMSWWGPSGKRGTSTRLRAGSADAGAVKNAVIETVKTFGRPRRASE